MAFPIEFRKVWALTKRDAYDWSSYRSQVLTTILTAAVGTAAWGFNATFRNVGVPQYQTDYVSFLVTGILVANIITSISTGLANRMKPWTLETVLMTGIRAPTFVVGTASWTYLLAIVLFLPQLALGIVVFGVKLVINPVSLALAVLVSSAIILSITMIAIGIRLVTKVNDPVTWSLTVAAQLLSGMTFPVQHLDSFLPGLSSFSWLLPQTWVYHIVRVAALEGASPFDSAVAISFIEASLIALIMVPLALLVFRWGLRRAKKDGTLGWY